MIVKHAVTGEPSDTWKLSWNELHGLLKFLSTSPNSADWVRVNGGPTAIHRFAVAFRLRATAEHRPLSRLTLHYLARMDPPPCRCGRPGTRLIGAVTFCRDCGPTPEAAHARRWRSNIADYRSADIETVTKRGDETTRNQARLRHVKKFHK